MQVRINTLVVKVREEYRTSNVQHTDALVDLADGIEHIKHLLSRTLRHSPLSQSIVRGDHVSHQGSDSPPQYTGVTVRS